MFTPTKPIINFYDALMAPLLYILVMLFAQYIRNKRYDKNDPTVKYFFPALNLKILGGLLVGLIYIFYYGGGDTELYYKSAIGINRAMLEDPEIALKIYTVKVGAQEHSAIFYEHHYFFLEYISRSIPYWRDQRALNVSRIYSIPSFLTLGSYAGMSILASVVSFFGVWGLFRAFYYEFPAYHKRLALAILYLPSLWFWGSGLLKDSLTFAGLGLTTYAIYKLFKRGGRSPLLYIYLILGANVVYVIKPYILLSYIPFISLWIGITLSLKIQNAYLRSISLPLMLLVAITASLLTTGSIKEDDKFSSQNVLKSAQQSQKDLNNEIYYKDRQGSRYSIPDFDGSALGTLKIFPQAFMITFFRPFLWEVRNPFMLLSALESLFFIVIIVRTLIRSSIIGFFKEIFKNPFMLFCILYALFFGFMVAISSGNFGNLVRYKVPCLPFLLAPMLIVDAKVNEVVEREQQKINENRLQKFKIRQSWTKPT